MALGTYYRLERKKKNITLEELSKLTGISKSKLSRIERGEQNPFYEEMVKISDCLGINRDAAFELSLNDRARPSRDIEPIAYKIKQAGYRLVTEIEPEENIRYYILGNSGVMRIHEEDLNNLNKETDAFLRSKIIELSASNDGAPLLPLKD